MNLRQIESWVLRIIDCVNAKQPHEDSRVELKREWPQDHWKAARGIAGHANAARGESILWLIGVDENMGVLGVDHEELANWYPAIKANFDELAPALTDLNVPVGDKTVVALLLETDRSPFVIKSCDGGTIHREVPWREGTSLRSANRSDLIKLLAPLDLLPEVEVLDIYISATKAGIDEVGNPIPDLMYLTMELYIVPKNNALNIIPFHRCKAWFEILDVTPQTEFSYLRLHPHGGPMYAGMSRMPQSLTMKDTTSELIIDGPGRVSLKASTGRPTLAEPLINHNTQITVHLLPANAERPIILSETANYPSNI